MKTLEHFLVENNKMRVLNIEDTLWTDGMYGLNNSIKTIDVLFNYLKGKKINTPIIEKLDAIPTLIMGVFDYQPVLFDENGQAVIGTEEPYLLLDHEGFLQFDEKSLEVQFSDAAVKNKQKIVKIKTNNHYVRNQFFVATRSLFNKTGAKLVFTSQDIAELYKDSDLANKLNEVLKYAKELKIKTIMQGDLLFTKENVKTEKIDDVNNILFRSNTIIYGVPETNEMYNEIKKAEIGIFFYAKYVGDFRWIAVRNKESNKIERIRLSADWLALSNNIDVDEFDKTENVFYDVSLLKDTLTKNNRKKLSDKVMLEIEEHLQKINDHAEEVKDFIQDVSSKPMFKDLRQVVLAYLHQLFREPNSKTPAYEQITYSAIYKFISKHYEKRVALSKQEKTKGNKITNQNIVLSQLTQYKKELSRLFTIQYHIEYIKYIILQLLSKSKLDINSFVQTNDGLFFQVLPTQYVVSTGPKTSVRLSDRGNSDSVVSELD